MARAAMNVQVVQVAAEGLAEALALEIAMVLAIALVLEIVMALAIALAQVHVVELPVALHVSHIVPQTGVMVRPARSAVQVDIPAEELLQEILKSNNYI